MDYLCYFPHPAARLDFSRSVAAKFKLHVVTISPRLMGLHSRSFKRNGLHATYEVEVNVVGGGGEWNMSWRRGQKPGAQQSTWSFTHSLRCLDWSLRSLMLLCGAPRMLHGFWMPRAPVSSFWVNVRGRTSGKRNRWKALAAEWTRKSHRYFLRKTFLYKYSYILQLGAETPVCTQHICAKRIFWKKNPIVTLFEWILARNLFSYFLAKTHDGSRVGGGLCM